MSSGPDNYMELCRLCACYDAIKMEIFGREGRERQLVDKIQTCLPLQVSVGDKLPKSLCYRCMYNLESFYDFRKRSVNAVALLESCIEQPTNDTEEDAEFTQQLQELRKSLCQVEGYNELQEMPHLEPQLPVRREREIDIETETDTGGPEASPTNTQTSEKEDMDIEEVELSAQPGKDSKETLHTCSTCNKAFSSKGHLALHNKIHLKDNQSKVNSSVEKTPDSSWKSGYYRPYRCDLCNKSYSTAKHRWGHVSVCHRGNPLVTCPICARVFSTCYNLGEHKRTKHGLDEGEVLDGEDVTCSGSQNKLFHTCTLCLKVFATELELKQHSLCHSDNNGKCDMSRNMVTRKKSETLRKADLVAIPGSNSETSLLKRTLLQSRELSEVRSRKRSLSPDNSADEIKIKKRSGSMAETGNNNANRRKSSKPRKIARNESEDFVEEENKEDNFSRSISTDDFPLLEIGEKNNTQDDAVKEVEPMNKNNAKPFVCLLCERRFSLRTSLSRHFNACHGIDPSEIMDQSSKYQALPPKKVESAANSHVTNKKCEVQKKNTIEVIELGDDEDDDDDNDVVFAESRPSSQSGFLCEVCMREFGDRASLWLHLRYTHKEFAAYACGICLQICEDNMQLQQHWRSCHPPDHSTDQRRYSCQICGRQHDSRKKLLAHVNVHNLDDGAGGVYNPEMLILLNTSFYSKIDSQDENLVSNNFETEYLGMQMAKETSSFGCELCYKSFPTEDGLVKHKKGAHKLSSEQNVGGVTNTRGSYQLYFVCELCGSSHRSKSERWRHVFRTHGGESALTCDRQGCGKVFPTRSLKQDHCTNHHRLQGAMPNVCEICGKLWSSRVDFWKHLMGVHADCVALTCGVCLKVFCTVPDLQTHVHTNHLPLTGGDFCCDICGRPYSNRSKLSRHRRIHSTVEVGDSETSQCFGKEQSLPERGFESSDYSVHCSSPKVSSIEMTKKSEANATKAINKASITLNARAKSRKTTVVKPNSILFCDACPHLTFDSLAELADHRRKIHSLQPCDLCSKFYGRTTHLWKHVKRVHNNHPELTCPVCKRISASKTHLETHVSTKHSTKTPNHASKMPVSNFTYIAGKMVKIPTLYPCQKCSKRFWKRCLLKKHQRHCLRTNKPKACDMCPKVFVTASLLKEHQRTAHVPQHCELCPNIFYTSKVDLLTHIRDTHFDHPNFSCSVPNCLKMLRCKFDLDVHQQQHKSLKFPPTCYLCGEVCSNKARLWTHLTSSNHKIATPMLCGVCFNNFSSTEELIRHVECLHSGALDTPNTCKICAKTYSSIYKVMAHFTKCHPHYYTCRECLQVFKSKEELQVHNEKGHDRQLQYINSDENDMDMDEKVDHKNDSEQYAQFPCELCDEAFLTEKDWLEHSEEKHKKIQEDLAPAKRTMHMYSCEKCSEIFNSASELADHLRKLHTSSATDSKQYDCSRCDKHFSNKSSYWKHINSSSHLMKQTVRNCETPSVTANSDSSAYVYINDSAAEENFVKFEKFDKNYISTPKSLILKTDEVNEHIDSGGRHTSSILPEIKPTSQKSETRKVYSDSPESKSPCYCQLCGKEWPAHKHLWQHLIRNHKQEAAVTCGVCLKVCSDYHKLSSHLSSQHPHNFSGKGNCFTCRICGRYHNARSKLIQHATIHTVLGVEPQYQPQSNLYNCQICFKSFTDPRTLQDHQKVHNSGVHHSTLERDDDMVEMETENMAHNAYTSPEKLFSCKICPVVFKNESLFLKHKQTHIEAPENENSALTYGMTPPKIEKQDDFVCKVCSLVFLTEKGYTTHLESHKCPVMPSVSSGDVSRDSAAESKNESTYFTQTKLLHRTFTCSHCKKRTFTSYINLTKHYRFCQLKKIHPSIYQINSQLLQKKKSPSQRHTALSEHNQNFFLLEDKINVKETQIHTSFHQPHNLKHVTNTSESSQKTLTVGDDSDRNGCNTTVTSHAKVAESFLPADNCHPLSECISKENGSMDIVSETETKYGHDIIDSVKIDERIEKSVRNTIVTSQGASTSENSDYCEKELEENHSDSNTGRDIFFCMENKTNDNLVSKSNRAGITVINSMLNQCDKPEQSKTTVESVIRNSANFADVLEGSFQGSVEHLDQHIKEDIVHNEISSFPESILSSFDIGSEGKDGSDCLVVSPF